jgi:hypothetical protein
MKYCVDDVFKQNSRNVLAEVQWRGKLVEYGGIIVLSKLQLLAGQQNNFSVSTLSLKGEQGAPRKSCRAQRVRFQPLSSINCEWCTSRPGSSNT